MQWTQRRHLAALAAALMTTFSLGAAAQGAFPAQSIKIIVPFTPGTGMDTIARIVAPRLSERLGQPVVVQNQAGASGNIGADAVAKSMPDGYTVLMGANTMLMAAQMYNNVNFDPVKDFSSVSMAAYGSLMLVANPKTGFKNLPDLIKQAQARPGAISFGSPGVGTPHHMAMELFKLESNTFMLHVPYRGSAGYTQDLLSGEVNVGFLPVHVAQAFVKSGECWARKKEGRKPPIDQDANPHQNLAEAISASEQGGSNGNQQGEIRDQCDQRLTNRLPPCQRAEIQNPKDIKELVAPPSTLHRILPSAHSIGFAPGGHPPRVTAQR
jgi:hypothetical protein